MKILITAKSFRADYGGPAVSIPRLALEIAQLGNEVGLWSADETAPSDLPDVGKVSRLGGPLEAALREFGRPDLLHDNGLWMPHNHRIVRHGRRSGIPILVSLRGMLEPWAMNHKRIKKWIAWRGYQRSDLMSARCLHASNANEAFNARALGFENVRVIANGIDVGPQIRHSENSVERPRKAAFLGRIYPVKGLPMLIDAWSRLLPRSWVLEIAGPDEAGHRGELERLVELKGLSDVISFVGPVAGSAKSRFLADADLMVAPSHTESFGMAIGEALAHGVPVLTTTSVPWAVLEDRGCGWRVEPTVEGLLIGLRVATTTDPRRLREMGAVGRELVATDFSWTSIGKSFAALAHELVEAQAQQPTRVRMDSRMTG